MKIEKLMFETRRLIFSGLSLILCFFGLIGCGKAGHQTSAGFENATPEIKEAWDKATQADRANDYVTAVASYKQILTQQTNLQESQIAMVKQALGILNQRLMTASINGDAVAKTALATLVQMERTGNLR